MRKLLVLVVIAAALALAGPASAAVPAVFGGDVACDERGDGIRLCGGSKTTTKTFDGVPIDVNVVLPRAPASGSDGPYPLVMLFHGYAGSKLSLDQLRPWAHRGYVAFSMTTRGFGYSCGTAESRAADPAGCAEGYVRLMDTRYEVRDAQTFAGRLADEGLVDPERVGAIGGSYGGGMSLALAALRDRQMLPDGSLVPWRSPEGKPMEIAGAAPDVPWSDLAYALVPNGGTLDYVADSAYAGRYGVMKSSYVTGLYASGLGFNYAPKGADPEADLRGWYERLSAGGPYDGDPEAERILDEVTAHHSAYYIDHSRPPAPLLISNGWTDDLFPVDEALRFYNRTRSEHPDAEISMFLSDHGHPRGQSKEREQRLRAREQRQWLDYYVKGEGKQPYAGVKAMTETCPSSAPPGGPYRARSWARIAPGEIRLRSAAPQRISADAGATGSVFDPITGGGACATVSGEIDGAAGYELEPAPEGGYTLLGSPTVIAEIAASGADSQIAARLLDVAPNGEQKLVARQLFRPELGDGSRQVFQLHPNGWHFEEGHVARLQLLNGDSPYGLASNGAQSLEVSELELRLPVRERPGAHDGLVKAAAERVLPDGDELAADFAALAEPNARLAPGRLEARGKRVRVELRCPRRWQSCDGRTVLRRIGKRKPRFRVARGAFTVPGGEVRAVRIKLGRKARRTLRKRDRLKVRATTVSVAGTRKVKQRRFVVP